MLQERHQKDLDLLKERLDLLDDNQRAQLDEFRDFGKASTPIKEPRDCLGKDLDLSLEDKDGETEKGDIGSW